MHPRIILSALLLSAPFVSARESEEEEDPSRYILPEMGETLSEVRKLEPDPSLSDTAKLARLAGVLREHGALQPVDGSLSPRIHPGYDDNESLPRILFLDRLSDGKVITVWKGRADRLHLVQTSADQSRWRYREPTDGSFNGVGIRSEYPDNRHAWYRVLETPPPSEDDLPILRASETVISVIRDGDTPTHIQLKGTFGRPFPPSSAEFYLDGEIFGEVEEESERSGLYRIEIPTERFLPGIHAVHAKLITCWDAPTGETGGAFDIYQSPYILFDLRNDGSQKRLPLGLRSTEPRFGDWSREDLKSTDFTALIPARFSGWTLRLFTGDPGRPAPFFTATGEKAAGLPLSLSVPWPSSSGPQAPQMEIPTAFQLLLQGPSPYQTRILPCAP